MNPVHQVTQNALDALRAAELVHARLHLFAAKAFFDLLGESPARVQAVDGDALGEPAFGQAWFAQNGRGPAGGGRRNARSGSTNGA